MGCIMHFGLPLLAALLIFIALFVEWGSIKTSSDSVVFSGGKTSLKIFNEDSSTTAAGGMFITSFLLFLIAAALAMYASRKQMRNAALASVAASIVATLFVLGGNVSFFNVAGFVGRQYYQIPFVVPTGEQGTIDVHISDVKAGAMLTWVGGLLGILAALANFFDFRDSTVFKILVALVVAFIIFVVATFPVKQVGVETIPI